MSWIETKEMRIANVKRELARMMWEARRGQLTKTLVEMNQNIHDLVNLCPPAIAKRVMDVARKIVYQAHLVAINRILIQQGKPRICFVVLDYKTRQMMAN